jgi:hypothetical protein
VHDDHAHSEQEAEAGQSPEAVGCVGDEAERQRAAGDRGHPDTSVSHSE